jgi:Flp pilus assembly protein TadG
VLLTPVFFLLLLLVVYAGRLSSARGEVTAAAATAARTASIYANADGPARADAAARESLSDRSITCPNLAVVTDYTPGGGLVYVDVTVTCGLRMSDLGALGLPGVQTVTAEAREVIDQYRGQ